MKNEKARQEAIEANIFVHSALANSGEYNKSPHFRPENKEKVRNILGRIVSTYLHNKCQRSIDFGCGTGFLTHMLTDFSQHVDGIDITEDMMKQIDLSSGKISLHLSPAENTPFGGDLFDLATAYSFLDHLVDYKACLREAYRVLRTGGVFYSDLNPNRDFIELFDRISRENSDYSTLPAILRKEILGSLHNGDYYQKTFGLDATMLEKAEPGKTISRGFCAKEFELAAREIGFSECNFEYEWYLDQARIIHGSTRESSEGIEGYLQSILPASKSLFKYLRVVLIK
ncbi:MAG: class I SAM-dependent methyltransferase [Bdellovibrionaceae bacterium]|nr:class I SAM-dependent methyltransferase [Pseudobdellovibrionaceae bacterium]